MKGQTTCSSCKRQPDCSFAAEMPGSPIIDALERNQSMNADLSSISETHLPDISVCAHRMIALATAYGTRMSLGPMMGYARILSGGNGGPIEATELCTRNAEHRRQPHLASTWFSQSVAPHAAYTCYCVSLLSLNCVAISNLLSIESKSRRPRQKNAPRGPVDLKSVVWNNVGQLRGLIYPVSLALCGERDRLPCIRSSLGAIYRLHHKNSAGRNCTALHW